MLIETDVLLAALNWNDPLRSNATRVLYHGNLLLSPYSLLEVNLLRRARKLVVDDFDAFALDIWTLFERQEIRVLPDRAEYHARAASLESRFQLTFFDSLHAAVAMVEKEIVVSFDKAYDKLRDAGLRRLDPREFT